MAMIPYERKLLIVLSVISIVLLVVNSYFHLKHEAHPRLILPPSQSTK